MLKNSTGIEQSLFRFDLPTGYKDTQIEDTVAKTTSIHKQTTSVCISNTMVVRPAILFLLTFTLVSSAALGIEPIPSANSNSVKCSSLNINPCKNFPGLCSVGGGVCVVQGPCQYACVCPDHGHIARDCSAHAGSNGTPRPYVDTKRKANSLINSLLVFPTDLFWDLDHIARPGEHLKTSTTKSPNNRTLLTSGANQRMPMSTINELSKLNNFESGTQSISQNSHRLKNSDVSTTTQLTPPKPTQTSPFINMLRSTLPIKAVPTINTNTVTNGAGKQSTANTASVWSTDASNNNLNRKTTYPIQASITPTRGTFVTDTTGSSVGSTIGSTLGSTSGSTSSSTLVSTIGSTEGSTVRSTSGSTTGSTLSSTMTNTHIKTSTTETVIIKPTSINVSPTFPTWEGSESSSEIPASTDDMKDDQPEPTTTEISKVTDDIVSVSPTASDESSTSSEMSTSTESTSTSSESNERTSSSVEKLSTTTVVPTTTVIATSDPYEIQDTFPNFFRDISDGGRRHADTSDHRALNFFVHRVFHPVEPFRIFRRGRFSDYT